MRESGSCRIYEDCIHHFKLTSSEFKQTEYYIGVCQSTKLFAA